MNRIITIKTITENEFQAEGLASPLPVLVDFFTPTCGPCKTLAPTLEELATENAGKLKIVKVNAGTDPTLAGSYRIAGVPTLLLFRDGKVVAQSLGDPGKKKLQKWIAESLASRR